MIKKTATVVAVDLEDATRSARKAWGSQVSKVYEASELQEEEA